MDQDESTEPKKIEPISPDWVHESIIAPGETDQFNEITDPVIIQPEPPAEKVDFEQVDLGNSVEPVAEPLPGEPIFQDAIVDEMIDHDPDAIGEVLDGADEPLVAEDLGNLLVDDQVETEGLAIDMASAAVENIAEVKIKESEEPLPTWLEATLDEPKPIFDEEITDKIKLFPSIEKVTVSEPPEEILTPVPALPLVPEEDIDIPVEEAYRSQHRAPEKRFLGMTAIQRFFFFLLFLIFLVILGALFLVLSGKIAIPF